MHKFRASSLADIMTDPKNKDEVLSVGAKTCVMRLAKELAYGYDERFSSKYTDKGIQVEDEAIELYNSVFFTGHQKNTERKTNEWITGECDIAAPSEIIDIKSPWSLATFPATAEMGKDKAYEWQGRAYMMLWGKPAFTVAYCLVNTPIELIGYEDERLHFVDHINPELRVTLVRYERDIAIEEKIKQRCEAANLYLDAMVKRIADEHTY